MARISDDLRALGDDALAALFAHRPDLQSDPPTDLNALAQRLSTPGGARVGVDQLDRPTLQICHHVVLVAGHPLGDGRVRPDDLAQWLSLAPGEPDGEELLTAVSDALRRLREVGLVHGDPPRPVAGLKQVLAPPVAAGRTARRLLDLAPDDAVALVAGHHGVLSTDAAAARDRLAELLPRLGTAVLEGAPPEAVELLLVTVESQEYAVDLPGGLLSAWPARGDADPALALVRRGAVIPLTPTVGEVPRELRHALLREPEQYLVRLRPPAQLTVPGAAQEAATADAADRARRVVGLVEQLLEEWSRAPAVQLASGGLGVKELRRAGKLLDVDEREAGRIVELALAAGLLGGEHRSSEVLPSTAYDAWLGLDVPRRWAALAEAWWQSERLPSAAGSRDGGSPLPALHWQSPPGAEDARRRVLALLAEQPGLTEDDVLDRFHFVAPARFAADGAHELVVSGAYAEALLLGLIAGAPWPGVVAPWAPDGSAAWPGERAVGDLAAALPPAVTEVTLQADLTAVAAGTVAAETARVLDLLADVESRGAATVWRFGPATVRRAFDDGWSAPMVLHELEQVAPKGVPGTLASLVADAARRHGQVRVGAAASYVRCVDEAVLAELTRAKRLAALKLRVVAPLVAVSPTKPGKVVELLQAAGYSPAADDGGGVTVGRAAPRRGNTELVASIRLSHLVTRRTQSEMEPGTWVRRIRVADEPEVRRRRAALDRLAAAARQRETVKLTYVVGGQQRQHRVVPLSVDDLRVVAQRVGRDGVRGERLDLQTLDVLDVG